MIALGIDIGGTSIKGAIVDEKGHIGVGFNMPIIQNESQDAAISRLIGTIDEFLINNDLKNKIDGIGIGIPGTIDTKRGIVSYSSNLKWENLHIIEEFKKHFNCLVKITNDANAAAFGEAIFGAGNTYKDVIMVTLGTGVGGGVIINGHLFEGNEGKGTEIGHTTLIYNGIECGCGRKGCFEQYASATALIRQAKEALMADKTSLLYKKSQEMEKFGARTVFECVHAGDPLAIKVVDQYIAYLSEGLLNLCNIFRPECIVLSGGIANNGEYLVPRIVNYCEKQSYGYPRSPKTVIKVAELGYDSGIIGSACLILKK